MMINFLLELAIVHATLMIAYWVFLKNESQYGKLRIYLLSSLFLALIIPLLKLPKLIYSKPEVNDTIITTITMDPVIVSEVSYSLWSYETAIWLLYITISTFLLVRILLGIFRLILLKKTSITEVFNGLSISRTPGIEGSFTFFNWIFISQNIKKDQPDYAAILRHEQAHLIKGHSYDLLLLELFKVAFWWLPTVWIARKEIKKIHEYQADAYALRFYNLQRYSSILISSTLNSIGWNLASSFHHGLIFKRLKAMKQTSKKVSSWKLGAIGALSVLLIVTLACSEEKEHSLVDASSVNTQTDDEVFTVVEEPPQFPGGIGELYKFIAKNIKYPQEARDQQVEGRVFVQFVVDKDGLLSEIETIKGIGGGCDEEAERIMAMAPSFLPGKQRGKPVPVKMVQPIIFQLSSRTDRENFIEIEETKASPFLFDIKAQYLHSKWEGSVFSSEGISLAGVNIVLKGTQRGTVSDRQGHFKIDALPSDELVFSSVGYQTRKMVAAK